jgi:excinuclease ABC subunit C
MLPISGTIDKDRKSLDLAPQTTGVYIYRSQSSPIYIGKAINLHARLVSHLQSSSSDRKEAAIQQETTEIDYIIIDSEFKALVLEAHLISQLKPKYNVRWRDDKSYLYICVTMSEEYPKVLLARGQDIQQRKDLKLRDTFFGPFASSRSAESVVAFIRRTIPFCTQRRLSKTTCFYHKIGLCDPCPNKIAHGSDLPLKASQTKTYRANLRKVCRILNGNIESVQKEYTKELKNLIKSEQYEKAIQIRDAMKKLEFMAHYHAFRWDQFESYNQSTQAQEALLKVLQRHFPSLTQLRRIECYDNSTLSFLNNTASMVVYTDGLIDKKEYKRFKLAQSHNNDFDMMREVIMRRSKHTEWLRPDLIIIDGGAPQLKAIQDALEKVKVETERGYAFDAIPMIGIAKRPDRLILIEKTQGEHSYIALRPKPHDLGFRMVQSIRDEAHRFAKRYHTHLRDRSMQPEKKAREQSRHT